MVNLLRPLVALAALAAGGLGLSACSTGLGNDAAQVGSSSISRSELTDMLSAINADAGFHCVITGGGANASPTGAGDSYNAAFSAQILTTLVESRALAAAMSKRHLSIGPLARSLGTNELEQALAPGGSSDQSCTTPAAAVVAALPASVRDHFIDLQAAEDVLVADSVHVPLSEAGVAAWGRKNPSLATVSCLLVAAFPSQGTASSFEQAVSAGGDFSSLAAKDGTQPQSGCVPAGSLPAPLPTVIGALSSGQVSSPTAYNGSYLVIQLTSRHVATGAEAAGLLMSSTASRVSAIVSSALAAVPVSVDPAFGSWKKVSSGYQVVPPKSPPAGILLNPSAVAPSGALPAG